MATEVRNDVLAHGITANGKSFRAAYDRDAVDGALLLVPIHGMLEADDPRVVGTVQRIQQELGHGPFLHRYRVDDGVGGEEGAFTLCGFWLAEVLAMMGRVEEAQLVFTSHAEASNHLGLLAEEIDPVTRVQLGNFPQAFSHLGLINAAARIDLALRMRDEGLDGVPHVTDWLETRHR
jgi:GH15 family glucan-1,4-alpha-glucosidase